MTLPARAEVVIVGGGVIGTSIAFHLAEAGVTGILLLERNELGSGSTSKAAGGVRANFSDDLNIALGARSLEAFARFGQRPGQEIDLRRVGYLFLLSTNEQVELFEQSTRLQNAAGQPTRMLDVTEAVRLAPILSPDGLLAACFSPNDGHCTPESVVLGYATAARKLGARLVTGCDVLGIDAIGNEIRGVRTSRGSVATSTVICAAGAWSEPLAATAGVELPVTPLRRQIVVTAAVPGLPRGLPMTIDFSSTFYFHSEGPGLLIGMSDPDEQPGFRLDRSEAWFPRLTAAMEQRAPSLLDVGLTGGWAGLYENTPDHNALIGEAPDVGRFLYATGFSGHGFLQGPAVGEIIRDLYLGRDSFVDVSPLDAGRFRNSGPRAEQNIV
ncbi:NAD(P)/FAD-dependent oxidoreductase [Kribbella sp. CA-293567]|uniref:NAD(P)/FAD-dependent oxidoreductase n=1 Tax=Kribbella sp. CA-293567 TaxID=3002436 RepID=UPI0022DE4F9A|nr:FAD-binding oxidoreductase [Kribbella sp. CA-293567]WBQ04689.1 FAD-binding oxidoreductase [Kribbella sp. CA-293567]